MPYTATLAMVAAAAMAGVPLFNGFLSKEMFFAEAAGMATQMRFGWLLPLAVTVAGIFAVAYSLRFVHDVFFNGEPIDLPRTPHEPPQLDEGAGGGPGGPVPAGGHPAGPDRGAHPGPGGGRGVARAAAPARSGHLARLQPGAVDERDRPGRRRPALCPTQAPVRLHERFEGVWMRGASTTAAGRPVRLRRMA
jgi:hypothetical protein